MSFPYVARKLGMKYRTFPGTIDDNPLFRLHHHKRSFLSLASFVIGRAAELSVPALADAVRSAAERPLQRLGALVDDGPSPALVRAAPARSGSNTIAVGPIGDLPSWSWVGFDPARELSKRYDVMLFEGWPRQLACDVLLAVKQRPPDWLVREVGRSETKLVYCPVDGNGLLITLFQKHASDAVTKSESNPLGAPSLNFLSAQALLIILLLASQITPPVRYPLAAHQMNL